MSRQRPHRNVPAAPFSAFLEGHLTRVVDLDGTRRTYLNGVWVDATHKRELRRYRHGQVATIRPATIDRLIHHFHLTKEYAAWQASS